MNPTVLTVSSGQPSADYYCYIQFRQSLMRYGVEPVILGQREEWTGLMNKPRRIRNWLREFATDSPIIVTDAWDVVFADSPEKVVEKFEQIRGDNRIIWNAERNLFPDKTLEFPATGTSFRYLNSGLSVGFADDYLALLESMNLDAVPDDYVNEKEERVGPNDQYYFQLAFLQRPFPMMLDSQCQIFQTLHDVEPYELSFDTEKILNRETGEMPLVFHLNGGSKTNGMRELVLEKLGFKS